MSAAPDVRRWIHAAVDDGWMDDAACKGEDPVLWFPNQDDERHYDKAVRALTMQARAICNRCPVKRECLDYAIAIDARHGMYGGLTEHERARRTKKRPY